MTLLDAMAFPASAFAELYGQRRAVELCLLPIERTMSVDVLRCRTPVTDEVPVNTCATRHCFCGRAFRAASRGKAGSSGATPKWLSFHVRCSLPVWLKRMGLPDVL